MLSNFSCVSNIQTISTKQRIENRYPAIAASDIISRFQEMTVGTARRVVNGQKHWLSVPLCPRYSKMHTRRTPGLPAATYHYVVPSVILSANLAITCWSCLKGSRNCRSPLLRSVSLPMRDLDLYRLKTRVGSMYEGWNFNFGNTPLDWIQELLEWRTNAAGRMGPSPTYIHNWSSITKWAYAVAS